MRMKPEEHSSYNCPVSMGRAKPHRCLGFKCAAFSLFAPHRWLVEIKTMADLKKYRKNEPEEDISATCGMVPLFTLRENG